MSELDFIYKRKSIRDYKAIQVPKEDILKMLEAATYAPSAKHQQNWHFVVVQNQELIDEMEKVVARCHRHIAELASTEEEKQKYMTLLPYYTNFKRSGCAIMVYNKGYYMIEEKILKASQVDMKIIEQMKSTHSDLQGIGAAVENFMLAASALGYGTCYMTGPNFAKEELEELIGFKKENYSLAAIISLGVPADETPKQPRRKPLEEVVTFI